MFSAAVTVASTPTAIVTTVNDADQTIHLHNNGSTTVFVGHIGVSTSNGFPIPSGAYRAIPARPGDVLYGVVATGTEDLRVLRRRD